MSLADWMSDTDYEWRTRLKRINLVVEADFTADEIWAAQKKYGAASQHLLNQPQRLIHDEIIERGATTPGRSTTDSSSRTESEPW